MSDALQPCCDVSCWRTHPDLDYCPHQGERWTIYVCPECNQVELKPKGTFCGAAKKRVVWQRIEVERVRGSSERGAGVR